MTPGGEETNLVLRTRDAVSLPARRLRWGNWLWGMLSSDGGGSRPTIPQRGRPVSSVWLRVREPRRVAVDLDRWPAEEEADPPEPASAGHAYRGRVRAHRGAGDPPATAVLDDRWAAQEVLTRRVLRIEAAGTWTVPPRQAPTPRLPH